MNNRTIGDRIRALRIGAGLSQDEMAEALFVGSRVSISQYESGKREPSIQLVMAYIHEYQRDNFKDRKPRFLKQEEIEMYRKYLRGVKLK